MVGEGAAERRCKGNASHILHVPGRGKPVGLHPCISQGEGMDAGHERPRGHGTLPQPQEQD